MKREQPVRVTYRNGNVENYTTDTYNLYSVLSKLDMSLVAGIEYGEAIINSGPAEFKPSGIQTIYRPSEGMYYMDIYDKNDKRVAYGKFTPQRLQQFAVDTLQQTTYRFTDLQLDHDGLKRQSADN